MSTFSPDETVTRGELGDDALRVYKFGVGRVSFDLPEISAALQLSEQKATAAVSELEDLRLLRRNHQDPGRLHVVPPRLASRKLLSPIELGIQQQHEELERLRLTFESLVPHYEGRMSENRASWGLELIPDLDDVRVTIERLTSRCSTEMLAAQPGGARDPEALENALARDTAMLARGVSMRTLYQHTARYSQPTIAYVERMAELGAEVRTVSDGFSRMLIFDREVGLLSVQSSSGAAVLVHEPNVVLFMVAAFQHAWQRADPFPLVFDRTWAKQVSGEIEQSIIELLGEGLEDKAIARRLGMSERTCQRHVSEIMRALGAKSRFQAGLLIGRSAAQQDAEDG